MTEKDDKIQHFKALKDDDEALWRHVIKDVSPLDHKHKRYTQNTKSGDAVKPISEIQSFEVQDVQYHHSSSHSLDHRTAQRLKRGKISIEGRLDLHGMTQIQAYDALKSFVLSAYVSKKRCLLVITGKGSQRGSGSYKKTGVLKQKVPEWLKDSPFSDCVLKVQTAHVKDGGEGALYIYLRRQRT